MMMKHIGAIVKMDTVDKTAPRAKVCLYICLFVYVR